HYYHLFCRHLRLPLRLLPRLALVEAQDRELPTDQKDCGASTGCNRRRTMRTLLINPVRSQPPHRISNNTSSRLLHHTFREISRPLISRPSPRLLALHGIPPQCLAHRSESRVCEVRSYTTLCPSPDRVGVRSFCFPSRSRPGPNWSVGSSC